MAWQFVRRLVGSRLGWVLLTIQLCFIIYWFGRGDTSVIIANMTADDVYTGRFIGGRLVELGSSLSWTLVLINVLPLLAGQALVKLLILLAPNLSVTALSWVQASQLLALSCLQWLLIGYFVERMIKLARSRV